MASVVVTYTISILLNTVAAGVPSRVLHYHVLVYRENHSSQVQFMIILLPPCGKSKYSFTHPSHGYVYTTELRTMVILYHVCTAS